MNIAVVGLMQKLRRQPATAALPGPIDPSTLPLASPWSQSSNLERIVFEDIFGRDRPENTRAAAMRLPTVARARNLVVSSIAGNPFASMRGDVRLPAPSWFTNVGNSSHQLRVAWTVDDLIFYGWSCWWRANGADGFPLAAGRVPIGEWSINADNRVEINGVEMPDNAVILIPGIHEGILTYGRDTIEDARVLYANVRKRLAAPTPGLNLQQEDGRELTNDEIDALIARWAAARRGDYGGVSFTSKGIKPVAMGGDDGSLMIDSRNAAAVDLARLIGVSAGLVDATAPKASLNYETQQGRNDEFVDRDLAQYMGPIVWRLSLDDVTPRGQRVTFDLDAFTTPDAPSTGPTIED